MTAPAGHRCGEKRTYPDRTTARAALARFIATTGAYGPRMMVFRCPRCRLFHYGRRSGFRNVFGRRVA